MAKSQKRSNREKKKPKADKPKAAATTSVFASTQQKANANQGRKSGK
jgi:hypothetical protein